MNATRLFLFLLVSIPCSLSANPFVTERIEGNVWVRSVLHDDGSHTVSKRDLTEKNQIVLERKNASGVLVSKTVLDLDTAGRHRRGQVFDGSERLRFVSDFVYDDNGKLKEEQIRNSQNKLVTKIVYQYDANGKARPMAVDYSGGTASAPRAVAEKSEWSTTSSLGYTGVPTNVPTPKNESSAVNRRRIFGGNRTTSSSSNSTGRKHFLRPWKNR